MLAIHLKYDQDTQSLETLFNEIKRDQTWYTLGCGKLVKFMICRLVNFQNT